VVSSVKFLPMTLIVDDVVYIVTLVCTRGLHAILGFGINKIGERRLWGRKAEAESSYLAFKAIIGE